ncbi:MAG: type II toxin-antitoxin system VapC family toxin [Actinobacteria bacterium]|nr:type II toxin-antitoxin system VapC family toxin [Actinomycetota bacterium]
MRAYLEDEEGHEEARALLADAECDAVTGAWSRIEVSGALVRAARAGRIDLEGLLELLDQEVTGQVTLVRADPESVEAFSLDLVRARGLRALDAWHLATAQLTVPALAEPSEAIGFATRDEDQGAAAEALGFVRI